MATAPSGPRSDAAGADAVVAALVAAGLLEPDRQGQARVVAAAALRGEDAVAVPLRRRLAELTGYVGSALVVAAVALVVAQEWSGLGTGARVAVLAAVAAVGVVAAAVVAATGGGLAPLRTGVQLWRRRLASVLFTAAAPAAAAAVAVAVGAGRRGQDDRVADLASTGTFLLLVVVGYLVAPTLLGHVAVAAGVAVVLPAVLRLRPGLEPIGLGAVWIAAGGVWVLMAETRRWREVGAARVVGALFLLVGAQTPLDSDRNGWPTC